MLRRCGRCGETKDIVEFAWRRKAKGQYDNYCRPCRAEYKREHYRANKQRYIDQASRRAAVQAAWRYEYLIECFRNHPCVDCGETDPVVLEFDHLRDKSFSIGQNLRYLKWQTILDEMAKCDVVCANCHRRRTAQRAGWARARAAESRPAARRDAAGR